MARFHQFDQQMPPVGADANLDGELPEIAEIGEIGEIGEVGELREAGGAMSPEAGVFIEELDD